MYMQEQNQTQHWIQIEEPSNNSFTIYSKTNCRYCTVVKSLLNENKIPFNEINCDNYLVQDKQGFLNFIKEKAKREFKTFPMVFCDGNFIGGFVETERLITDLDEEVDF
jgi:glutaredoxin